MTEALGNVMVIVFILVLLLAWFNKDEVKDDR